MDKILKFLRKVDKKTRERVLLVIFKIEVSDFTGLDLKKLKGESNVYRVRVGDFRIMFVRGREKNEVIKIDKRGDRTYK